MAAGNLVDSVKTLWNMISHVPGPPLPALRDRERGARTFEKGCRQVVGRNAHATTPKSNMGYDQYTVRNDWSCRTYFCCFPLVLANICPWPPVPFFQISLKNSALKATHNTFRDCRVHFSRQPFSIYHLYWRAPSHALNTPTARPL